MTASYSYLCIALRKQKIEPLYSFLSVIAAEEEGG